MEKIYDKRRFAKAHETRANLRGGFSKFTLRTLCAQNFPPRFSRVLSAAFLCALLVFFSCAPKNVSLSGAWIFTAKYRQELAVDPRFPDEPFAALYVTQSIIYTFDDEGNYEKKIEQSVFDYDILSETDAPFDVSLYDGAQMEILIRGTYRASARKIYFSAGTVSLDGGEPMPYSDYYAQNPLIGEKESASDYSVGDGEMSIFNNESSETNVFVPLETSAATE